MWVKTFAIAASAGRAERKKFLFPNRSWKLLLKACEGIRNTSGCIQMHLGVCHLFNWKHPNPSKRSNKYLKACIGIWNHAEASNIPNNGASKYFSHEILFARRRRRTSNVRLPLELRSDRRETSATRVSDDLQISIFRRNKKKNQKKIWIFFRFFIIFGRFSRS